MKRREFIRKSSAVAGAYAAMEMWEHFVPAESRAAIKQAGLAIEDGLDIIEEGKERNIMPQIRPEILNNPRAVFLIETHVDATMNDAGFFADARPQLEDAGRAIAHAVFVRGTKKGGSTLIKPNHTHIPEENWHPTTGVITSPDFVAGFVEALRDIGSGNVIVSERGSDTPRLIGTGVFDVYNAKGIPHIQADYPKFSKYRKDEVNWHKAHDPVVWKRIPTTRPIGDKDNLFINMPKLKCHNLGLTTLTTKNLQGAVPHGYGQFCWRWDSIRFLATKENGIDFKRHYVKDYQEKVEAGFLKHRAMGYKYWDYEQSYAKYEARGGWDAFKKIRKDRDAVKEFMDGIQNLMWDEQWCNRALDASTAIPGGLNIVEGIIGRDGSGFDTGTDQLCNIVIAGMSRTEVDTVGTYIMGHDPREIFYTRIAKERGLGECDPSKVDIYYIRGNDIVPVRNLAELKRYRLGVNIHQWADRGERLFW